MLGYNSLDKFFGDDRLHKHRFGIFLFLIQFCAFPLVFLGLETFIYRDFGFFGYPLAHHHRESFWNGEIPFWNPMSSLGLPFLAQWNSMTLYPGSIIYLLLPLGWGVSVFCLVHQWIGGMGMYVLVYRWTKNSTAAALAGVIFSLNGLLLNALAWPNNSAAFAWFPWLLGFLYLAVTTTQYKWILWTVLVASLQMLTGGPEIIIFSWFFSVIVCLSAVKWNLPNLLRLFTKTSLIVLWVTLITSPQMFPFLRLIKESHRSNSYSSDGWSMPITGWGNFIVPQFQTFFSHAGVHFQPDQVWTTSYYLGIFTFVLIGMYLVSRPDKKGWTIFALAFFAANMALGPYSLLYVTFKDAFPALGFMRYPVKFVIIIVMALPILAGFGWLTIDRLWTNKKRIKPNANWVWIYALIITAISGFLLFYSKNWPLHREIPSLTIQNGITRIGFLWGLVVLTYICLKHRNHKWAKYATLAIPVIVSVELITHTANQNPTVDNEVLEPGLVSLMNLEPVPVHGTSRAMLSPTADYKLRFTSTPDPMQDYIIYRSGLFSNCNLIDGISKVNGFYSLYLDRTVDILKILYGKKPLPANPLKDFIGISHYTSQEHIFEWAPRESFLPFITSGQIPVFADDAQRLEILQSEKFEPSKFVYIDPDHIDRFASITQDWTSATIVNKHIERHRISLDVNSSGYSMLVIAQNHYPHWKAELNDQAIQIFHANHCFQAVIIPPGQHKLELFYRDTDFAIGAKLSGLGLFALALSGFYLKRKSKASQHD